MDTSAATQPQTQTEPGYDDRRPITRDESIRMAYAAEWSPVSAISPDAAQGYVDLFATNYPAAAQVCGPSRLAAAARIMRRVDGRRRGDEVGQFIVRSESNTRGWYVVDLLRRTCTCPDHPGITAQGGMCKHRLAVGLQVFGPDWVRTANYDRVRQQAEQRRTADEATTAAAAAETARHLAQLARHHAANTAQDAAIRAWATHNRLSDEYTALGEAYDNIYIMAHYFDARWITARQAVIDALAEAKRLQAIADDLAAHRYDAN